MALAFLVSVLLDLTPATAQELKFEYNVKMTARSLFEGAHKYGDWLPVEITLENFGASTTVQVEAVITNTTTNNITFPTVYRRPVSLGERSLKKFHLYIQPFVATSNVSRFVSSEQAVTLKTADGQRKLAEQNIRLLPVSPKDYLIGVVNSDPNLINYLNNQKVGKLASRVGVAMLGNADFPDRAEGWRSFNALVLSETNTSGLSADQQTALQDWVASGGQLILMGGNGWGRVGNGFDKKLLPVDVYDYAKVDNLDALLAGERAKTPIPQPVTIALGQVLDGAIPLATTTITNPGTGTNVVPLISERKIGMGRVLALAVDLTTAPLSDWQGANRVWQDILSFNSGLYYQIYEEANPQLKNSSDFFSYIATIPEIPLPGLVPFYILFGIYLLVICPVNYFLLLKMKKLVLAWFTIPVTGLVFFVVSLWLAGNQTPGEVLVSQMSVMQIAPGQQNAQVRSYVAIFSPDDKNYEIAPAIENSTPPLLLSLNRNSNNSFVDIDTNRLIIGGDQPRIENMRISQWSSQGFSLETNLAARNFQLQSNLYFTSNNGEMRIKGTITNNTDSSIKDIMLVLGEQIEKTRDINPGETLNVDFALPSPTQAANAFCSAGFGTFSSYTTTSVAERLQGALLADRQGDRLYQNRANFIRKLYEIGRYSPTNPRRGFDLIGWMDKNPVPVTVAGVNSLPRSNQVLLARLPVTGESPSEPGKIIIPSAYMHPENSVSDSGSAIPTSRLDRNDQVCLSKGTITSYFRVPVEITNFNASRMTLYINSFTANTSRTPFLPEKVELFDWKNNDWVHIKGVANSAQTITNPTAATINAPPIPNEIDNPGRYVHPQSGQIMLRFTAPSPSLQIQFGLGVEGGAG
jgi:hypothetical protein